MEENWFKLYYPHITTLITFELIYNPFFSFCPAKRFVWAIYISIKQNVGDCGWCKNKNHESGWKFLMQVSPTKCGWLGIYVDALKTTSKKEVSEAVEATGEFIGKKIADKIVKPKPISDENPRNVEEKIIAPEKREGIVNGLK